MNKIIGFLITKEELYDNIDFFNVGLNIFKKKFSSYNIYFWGIGDVSKCEISCKYSLSFPLSDQLYDRNVIISFEDDSINVENDWLGSIPIFYNKKYKIVSTLPNLCIRDKNINLDSLGLFCEFGYSVFEKTIFKEVDFLRFFSKIKITDNTFNLVYKDDPLFSQEFSLFDSNEDSVVATLKKSILDIESKTSGDIIIPTSGGYDSRLLNYLVSDKKRIKSFTYGISKVQSKSSEVIHAAEISKIFNTHWEQIELNDFPKYIDSWHKIYGFSTHLHGMYHIEFYTKIINRAKFKTPFLLSGIFGDIWAGSINYERISNSEDLVKLGYTHDLNLDLKYFNHNLSPSLKNEIFDNNTKYFINNKFKAVFTVRIKLILISYLTQLPEYFGIPVYTPFLSFENVSSMLNISDDRRKQRKWQKDLFRKAGLNFEDMKLEVSKCNDLDKSISMNSKFEKLDFELLSPYFDKERILSINERLSQSSILHIIEDKLISVPYLGKYLYKFGIKDGYMRALNDYFILKSIEKSLCQ